MRKALGLIVLLAGAAYAGHAAYMAYGTPRRPVSDHRYDDACYRFVAKGNRYQGSPHECQVRLYEHGRLEINPGVVMRDGETLTTLYRGTKLETLLPEQTIDQNRCDTYSVDKVLSLYDPSTQSLEKLAQISCHHGEFRTRFITLPDASHWIVRDALASPDGKRVAVGNNGLWQGNELKIYTWPSRQVLASFPVFCRTLEWKTAAQVSVTCIDVPEENDILHPATAFDATVSQGRDGRWTMQVTKWLDPRNSDYTDDDELEYAPVMSLRWPRQYAAL